MKKWSRPIKVVNSLSSPISACRFMLPYWNPYNPDGSLATNANGGWTGTTVSASNGWTIIR